jgi:uncharacterized protein YjbI with pentapeptide repeats
VSTGLASPTAAGTIDDLTGKALSEEKTRAEIRALGKSDDGPDYTATAGLITATVAAAGLVLTLRKQIAETAAQREADRAAKVEAAERRYDEQFTGLTEHLGADQPATRVGAAVGVTRFLRPQHREFHDDVTRLLIAHLKVQDDPTTLAVLRRGLERAFRLGPIAPDDRDLSNAKLDGIDLATLDLEGLNLTEARAVFANFSGGTLNFLIARRANLEKATFSGSEVREARCRGASCEGTDFMHAVLISASFKECNLKNTRFQGASLQSALFTGANLSGTRFDGSNLADAHFKGALIAPETYRSITRAVNWRRAHFDKTVRDDLEALAGGVS